MPIPTTPTWPRLHLTSALLSKPVALLAATELKKWRDGLLGTMAPVDDQPALPLPVRRAGTGGAARQAHQEPGRMGNRPCRSAGCSGGAQRHPLRRQGPRVRRRRLSRLMTVRAADRYAGGHGRASEPGGSAPRRGSARSSGAAEADDAEVRQGRRQESQREEDRALFGADHRATGGQAERGGSSASRPCAVAAAKRRQPLGRQSRRRVIIAKSRRSSPPSGSIRRRDDVRAAAFEHRPDAAAKRADQAGGDRCTTPRPR